MSIELYIRLIDYMDRRDSLSFDWLKLMKTEHLGVTTHISLKITGLSYDFSYDHNGYELDRRRSKRQILENIHYRTRAIGRERKCSIE